MPTRKKRKNKYTVKKQKGGVGPNQELLNVLKDNIDENILDINIPAAYDNLPKPMKINKVIIVACLKRIDEKYLEMKKRHTNKTPEEIHTERGEEIIRLYKFIPKPLKIDDEINHIFIYYEPHVMIQPEFPKRLLHNEISLKTAIERDPTVFYKFPKIYKRRILRDYPDLLLKSKNRLDINLKGKIRFDPDYLGLVRRVDAYSIGGSITSAVIASGILGPEIANVLFPFVESNIATPLTAALAPVGTGIATNIAKVGAALSPLTSALGIGLAAV
tara:strand:- start:1714 stop:2535 length:822 start_codon:yes stop_codon:yes gene_type:complete